MELSVISWGATITALKYLHQHHHHKARLYQHVLLFRVDGADVVLGFDDMAGLVNFK